MSASNIKLIDSLYGGIKIQPNDAKVPSETLSSRTILNEYGLECLLASDLAFPDLVGAEGVEFGKAA